MATPISPSDAVIAARQRRHARASREAARVEWFGDQVQNKINLSAKERVELATEFLKDKVVKNISKPVGKGTSSTGRVVVIERSRPGEFPRADTTLLMTDIFKDFKTRNNRTDGFVGTTLDYGLILETRMKRSFLRRTLNEERRRITRILGKPVT